MIDYRPIWAPNHCDDCHNYGTVPTPQGEAFYAQFVRLLLADCAYAPPWGELDYLVKKAWSNLARTEDQEWKERREKP
jgi:hypothetical protein